MLCLEGVAGFLAALGLVAAGAWIVVVAGASGGDRLVVVAGVVGGHLLVVAFALVRGYRLVVAALHITCVALLGVAGNGGWRSGDRNWRRRVVGSVGASLAGVAGDLKHIVPCGASGGACGDQTRQAEAGNQCLACGIYPVHFKNLHRDGI